MCYSLDIPASTERQIVQDAYRFGDPIPERIKNAPRLNFGLLLYYNAWFDLDGERSHYQGLQRIRRSQMLEYARDYELSEEQTDDLLYYVNRMDAEHIRRLEAKQPKTKPTKGRRGTHPS